MKTETDDDKNMRDLAAMFVMCGLIMRGENGGSITDTAYEYAEEFMETRANRMNNLDQGIAAIKPKRKYERKSA
jgi:hypothetical protein